MIEANQRTVNYVLGALLCLFTVAEVNYPVLRPESRLALFAMLGLMLCFLNRPLHPHLAEHRLSKTLDLFLVALVLGCCGYVIVQSEPLFESLWIGGQSLGNRAGQEAGLDTAVGLLGLLLVLEAARRSVGWALPALALLFLLYAYGGATLPGWLFPHRGYGVDRIVAQAFLHSQGVFGTALYVMFTYVFLFVLLGAVLRQTGATQFVIDFAQRVLGRSTGGPAKVSVLSSGMMGSLSGSAVANTATTGTFTIPMMRSSGLRPEIAGGVEAAASSGGALVPPVMGAGAYMMLEIIDPPVTYLQIIKAAMIPAALYYLSLFLIVHFYSRRVAAGRDRSAKADDLSATAHRATASQAGRPLFPFEGLIFFSGIAALVVLLLVGYTVFRAASLSLLLIVLVSSFHARTRLSPSRALRALADSARDAVPLVAAAACVGIVIGVVTLTGIGTKLPATVLDLSQDHLVSALVLIMISSIVLGMGMPSAVCYLLMATLIGPVLGDMGVVPLAAHLFIFYFGMMSMVTPPVALAAYTAASIAGSGIMRTGLAAFRFALVGFTLPYMFVFRPELLMLDSAGGTAAALDVLTAVVLAVLGILPFAAGISGYLFTALSAPMRGLLLLSAALQLWPAGPAIGGFPLLGISGMLLLAIAAVLNGRILRTG